MMSEQLKRSESAEELNLVVPTRPRPVPLAAYDLPAPLSPLRGWQPRGPLSARRLQSQSPFSPCRSSPEDDESPRRSSPFAASRHLASTSEAIRVPRLTPEQQKRHMPDVVQHFEPEKRHQMKLKMLLMVFMLIAFAVCVRSFPPQRQKQRQAKRLAKTAAICYLTPNRKKDLQDLNMSLASLKANAGVLLNTAQVIIFHEDVKTSTQESFQAEHPSLQLRFEVVALGPPTHLNLTHMAPIFGGWKGRYDTVKKKREGYSNMIRFWVKHIFDHPAMMGYEYYMRLDTDSLIRSCKYDVFSVMREHGYKYGFVSIVNDSPDYTRGLWEFTEKYFSEKSVTPAFPLLYQQVQHRHKTRAPLPSFYNNIEVVDLNFFKQPDVRAFANALDSIGGIYRYRWGDATIRLLQIVYFGKAKMVRGFCDCFEYLHSGVAYSYGRCKAKSYDGNCRCDESVLRSVFHVVPPW